jgi:hypothetical protein
LVKKSKFNKELSQPLIIDFINNVYFYCNHYVNDENIIYFLNVKNTQNVNILFNDNDELFDIDENFVIQKFDIQDNKIKSKKFVVKLNIEEGDKNWALNAFYKNERYTIIHLQDLEDDNDIVYVFKDYVLHKRIKMNQSIDQITLNEKYFVILFISLKIEIYNYEENIKSLTLHENENELLEIFNSSSISIFNDILMINNFDKLYIYNIKKLQYSQIIICEDVIKKFFFDSNNMLIYIHSFNNKILIYQIDKELSENFDHFYLKNDSLDFDHMIEFEFFSIIQNEFIEMRKLLAKKN